MIDAYARITTMHDMFLYAQNLYSWCFDSHYQLLYSNAENQEFFYHVFMVSSCFDAAKSHFESSHTPIILSDKTGIAWIADIQFSETDNSVSGYHVLGPFFTVEASESYLYSLCSKLRVQSGLIKDLMNNMGKLTTIPLNTAIRYAIMLHYCATGEQCSADDIALHMESGKDVANESWADYNWHGTWELEVKLFKQLRDGNAQHIHQLLSQFSSGHIGSICPEDPLRQAKDEMIIFVALCSRAAIMGGVSPEGSYNLADYYLQRIEACQHVSDVQNYSIEMFNAFLRRSKQAKETQPYSVPIANAMEYIENHISEKINLDAMAAEVGYARYYLSNKFQKEVGMSINNYIQKRKIETAKEMLRTSQFSVSDVSERLSFSSPSYFSSIFRKYTGLTPGDFLNNPSG